MAGKSYDVSAVPFEGFDSFNRAGRRWGTTPTTVTVSDVELTDAEKEGKTDAQQADALKAKLGPDEITQAQYDALKSDPRIRIYESNSAQAQSAKKAADARAEADRLAAEAHQDATGPKATPGRQAQRGATGPTGGATGASGPSGPNER